MRRKGKIMKYPQEITGEVLEAQAGISDEEIEKDIADTERDMERKELEIEGLETVRNAKRGSDGWKMASFRVEAARARYLDMLALVTFLRRLLEKRKEQETS